MLSKQDENDLILRLTTYGKYRHLYKPTLERLVSTTCKKYSAHPINEIEKRVRRQLHQVYRSFFAYHLNFANLERKIIRKLENEIPPEDIAYECMMLQSSTRERIHDVQTIYDKVFHITGQPRSIVDHGCGLNPFSLVWANCKGMDYYGYDLDEQLISFLNTVIPKLMLDSTTSFSQGDILVDTFPKHDVSMLLKMIPLLEQQEKGVGKHILESLPYSFAVVSFPTLSLSGKEKGMKEYYSRYMNNLVASSSIALVDSFECSNEIFFIVNKP